jgi:hypothetical protein
MWRVLYALYVIYVLTYYWTSEVYLVRILAQGEHGDVDAA